MKNIIFDLGGVLFTNGTKLFGKILAKRYSKDENEVQFLLNNSKVGNDYREGKIDRDTYWNEIQKHLTLRETIDELEREWIEQYELIEGTEQIIRKLKDSKYSVYFLSDNVRERVEKINKKFGFLNWFDGGIFSHEVGVRKPDPKVYIAVLRKFNLKPNECFFIDDKETNLPAAKALGITTLLFTSPEKLRKDLQNLKLFE